MRDLIPYYFGWFAGQFFVLWFSPSMWSVVICFGLFLVVLAVVYLYSKLKKKVEVYD